MFQMLPPVFLPDPRIGPDPSLSPRGRPARRHQAQRLSFVADPHALGEPRPDALAQLARRQAAPPADLIRLAADPRFVPERQQRVPRASLRGLAGLWLLRLAWVLLRNHRPG
jgi:hypothetical protein